MRMPPISVEVWRDHHTPDSSVDIAVRALLDMNQITDDGLAVIDSARLLPLRPPESKRIDTDTMRPLYVSTDYAIIVTRGALVSSAKKRKLWQPKEVGLAWPDASGTPFAIINTKQAHKPKEVVQHEMGHLLGVKETGKSYDGDCHCNTRGCTMSAKETLLSSCFCPECVSQIAVSVYKKRLQKCGIWAP